MPQRILRKGFRQISAGNYRNILDGVRNRTSSKLVEEICDGATAKWQAADGERARICRISSKDYIPLEKSSTIGFKDDLEIEQIEVPLLSPNLSHEIEITVDVADGNPRKSSITVEPFYEYPSIMWKTVELDTGVTPVAVSVETEPAVTQFKYLPRLVSRFSGYSDIDATRVGSPAIVPSKRNPPIFLISIDTLRWDQKEELTPLINALGEDGTVVPEPRTQGMWTPPSHASMFTGTHPGDHGYVGWGKGEGDKRPIDPTLTTIPELLKDVGYKCSGLVSHSQILPEFGFGRGFHRFRHDQMGYSDWITRKGDAKSSIDQMTKWIDSDLQTRDHSLFYFLHVFDLHNPYVPPVHLFDTDHINFSAAKRYENQIDMLNNDDWTYLDGYAHRDTVDEQLIREMREWYSKSVEYTAAHISRFVNYLKTVDLFDESMIIVTGDHGEEFGERGFYTHISLNDANIRPFMAVKPPRDASWNVPREIDTIDFLPTVAELVGIEIPPECRGHAMQTRSSTRPRITERIYPDWYSVAIEDDNRKGIFTYESNYPERPRKAIVESGPKLIEWYDIQNVRDGKYVEADIDSERENKLRSIAEEFLLTTGNEYTSDATAEQPSQETMDHLEKLGYK